MIKVNANFPVLTGNIEEDMSNIHDYLYKFEREIRHEFSAKEKTIRKLENRIKKLEGNNG